MGHDKLVHISLQELTDNPTELGVFPEINLSMAVLKASASDNLLAFSCCLSVFESAFVLRLDSFSSVF